MINQILIVTTMLFFVATIGGTLFSLHSEYKEGHFKWLSLVLVLELLVVILGFGSLLTTNHYSVDSYGLIYDMSPLWHLRIGRYTNCGVILVLQKLGINQVLMQKECMLVWCVSLALMFLLITCAIKKIGFQRRANVSIALSVIIALSFVNVFGMELMLFPEMAMVLTIGNLAIGLAVYFVLSDIRPLIKWGLFFIYLIIAIGCYQSYIGCIETFSLIGIFIKNLDNAKKRYAESIAALFLGGLVSLFNVVFNKLLIHLNLIADSGRGGSFALNTITSNIAALIKYWKSIWVNADGLLIPIMPAVGICCLAIVLYVLRKLANWEQRVFLILVLAGLYVLEFAAHLIEETILLTPRSSISFWSFISCVLILGCYFLQSKPLWTRGIAVITISLLFVNAMTMQDMAASVRSANAVDRMEARAIASYIKKYEESSNDKIEIISAVYDKNPIYYLPTTEYCNHELGARIMCTMYSNYRLIGYELGRDLEALEMPADIYSEYFEDKDWDYFEPAEQIVIKDNTLYLAVY